MADKIIAPLALLLLIAFLVVLAAYIDEVDLWVVIIFVSGLAIVDFWQALRHPENGAGTGG